MVTWGRNLIASDLHSKRKVEFNRNRNLLLEFTEMIEILLKSGLSVKDALEMVGASSIRSKIAELSNHLLYGVHRGLSIASAINALDDFFPPIYRGMIKFGDQVGSMEQIFPRLGAYLREQKRIREKLLSAMIYPAIVLFLAIAGSAALVVFILPKLEVIFGAFTLNEGEAILADNLQTMKLLFSFFLSILITVISFIPLLVKLRSNKTNLAIVLDRGLLKIPMLGNFMLSYEMLNFTFAMEILIGGGIPIDAALYESAQLIENSALKQSTLTIIKHINNGGSMAKYFAEDPLFPEYFSRWIAIGEQTKGIERIFSQIRQYYQDEIERKSDRLIILIEPCMIAITGIIITIIAVGLILPIFTIFGNLI